jgi:hypothetical protein
MCPKKGLSAMAKQNCWEFKKCGREPGGVKVAELGICPAAVDKVAHGINGGKCGGRACWALTGTFCGGVVQGSYAQKVGNCLKCEFYMQVRKEEGDALVKTQEILKRMGFVFTA